MKSDLLTLEMYKIKFQSEDVIFMLFWPNFILKTLTDVVLDLGVRIQQKHQM